MLLNETWMHQVGGVMDRPRVIKRPAPGAESHPHKRSREWQPEGESGFHPNHIRPQSGPTEGYRNRFEQVPDTRKRTLSDDFGSVKRVRSLPEKKPLVDESRLQLAVIPPESNIMVCRLTDHTRPSPARCSIIPYYPPIVFPQAPPSRCTIEQLPSDDEDDDSGMDVEL